MIATYSLSISELNADFLNILRSTFKSERVTIQVAEELDETEYLLSTKANRIALEESIQQSRNGETVAFDLTKALKENDL